MRRSKQKREALRILAGCARGSTAAALAPFGVTVEALAELVATEEITTWTEEMHAPPITVRWYAIIREDGR